MQVAPHDPAIRGLVLGCLMAGDWIKLEVTTPEKREVYAIAESLGIEPDAVLGKLVRVWSWFDQHLESGDAVGVTKALLDRVAGVPGFADALQQVAWLEPSEHGFMIPNFERHNGKTAKTRALTAKRNASFRDRNRDEPVTPKASPSREKRREEKKDPPPAPSGLVEFTLPPWIKPETWKAYEEMRVKIKKPMTPRARDLVVGKLLDLGGAEHRDVDAILEQSIRNSWQDVYALKTERAAGAAGVEGRNRALGQDWAKGGGST